MNVAVGAWGATEAIAEASVVVTEPALEPVSLVEVKNHLRRPLDSTAEDPKLQGFIMAARKQVEKDLGGACLVATVIDQYLDRLPTGRILTLPRWPLQSVATVKTYDEDDVVSTMSSGDYLVDTASRPGRVLLNADASWPTGLRFHQGVIVRHTSGFSGIAKAITSITRSSATATVTTTAAHGYATGNRITIAGSDMADYNGTFEITVTGAATFTFTVANSPTSPATGTMTATNLGISECYTLAILLLIGHWYMNREAVSAGEAVSPFPFGYDSLLSDALEILA